MFGKCIGMCVRTLANSKRTNYIIIIASADAHQKLKVLSFLLLSAFNTTKLLNLVGEIIACERRRPREPGQKLVVKLESTLIP